MTVDEKVKIASVIGAVIVGAATAYTYFDTANREVEKPFNDAQLRLCIDASDVAAHVASVPPSERDDRWMPARMRFEELYWGSLAIVENANVEGMMVRFRNLLLPMETKVRANTLSDIERRQLQNAALNIAHACRALVSKTWRLRLPTLSGKPTTE
jgi:hypothetical protein